MDNYLRLNAWDSWKREGVSPPPNEHKSPYVGFSRHLDTILKTEQAL